MGSIHKKVLINSLITSLKNTQKNRSKNEYKPNLGNELINYLNEIYPYVYFAIQCIVNDADFNKAVEFDLQYNDEKFSLKQIIKNKEYKVDFTTKLTVLSFQAIGDWNVQEHIKLAYCIVLINVMAFYEINMLLPDISDILVRLVLVFFGDSCLLRLKNSINSLSQQGIDDWNRLKLQCNTHKDVNELLKFIYGTKISPKLETALFDSLNTILNLTELNLRLNDTLEDCAFVDLNPLLEILKNDDIFNNITSEVVLPIKNIKKHETESNQQGYYDFLFSIYDLIQWNRNSKNKPQKHQNNDMDVKDYMQNFTINVDNNSNNIIVN